MLGAKDVDAKVVQLRIILKEDKTPSISQKIWKRRKNLRGNIVARNVQSSQDAARDAYAGCQNIKEREKYQWGDAKYVDAKAAMTMMIRIRSPLVPQEVGLVKVQALAGYSMKLSTT